MSGTERIAAERKRQMDVEDWTPGHDAQHTDESLIEAAICYAVNKSRWGRVTIRLSDGRVLSGHPMWPHSWLLAWDKRKKHDRLRSLEIAGALIAAEIDRLQTREE